MEIQSNKLKALEDKANEENTIEEGDQGKKMLEMMIE